MMAQVPAVKLLEHDPKAEHKSLGGGLEGADRFARETAHWMPAMGSADQIINTAKPIADARSRDMVANDGQTYGAVAAHQNGIVGGQYRLNAKPNWRALQRITGMKSFDAKWAEEYQEAAEIIFDLLAESEACYLDASGKNTFSGLVRLALAGFVTMGEVLAAVEWIRERNRPIRTALQMVSPDRLSNPDDQPDTRLMRRGIEHNARGKPIRYHIRRGHPTDFYSDNAADAFRWVGVDAEKPWGRKQIIHIIEQRYYEQSRGIADMVAALKQMRMTKRFSEITLQSAVINATYAAAIESELPPELVSAMMGASANGPEAYRAALATHLNAMGQYVEASQNIGIDGAKMPHLFPNTKLSLKPVGTPGGIGTGFEESLKRGIAAALGLSYEEFTKDFSKVSYPAAKASMASTERFIMARKKTVADRFANNGFSLVVEELMADLQLPLPRMTPRMMRSLFYLPLAKEALTRATWIGAGRGQIDELKETQAAILRIKSGLSTYEIESAKLGVDFRELFEQRAREETIIASHGLAFALDTQRPGAKDRQNTLSDDPDSGTQNENVTENDGEAEDE